ncbi:MAG: O-antigen ligase family protein [Patulibacter sp.]
MSSALQPRHAVSGPSPLSAFDEIARYTPRLTISLLVAAALAAGLLISVDARLGLAAAGAAVFVAFLLADLPIAIGIWVVALCLAGVPGTQGAPTGTSVLLLAGWAGTLANQGPRLRSASWSARGAFAATAALMLWTTASYLWAGDPGAVVAAVKNWGIAVAALPVIVTACRNERDVLVVAGAYVAGITLSVLVGLTSGSASAPVGAIEAAEFSAGRLQVGITDPNYLAANIVASMVVIAGLLRVRLFQPVRPLLLLAVPVLLYGLIATQSRGGLLAALVAAVLTVILLPEFRTRVLAGVGAALGGIAVLLMLQPRALERLTQSDSSGTGRTDLWSAAWAVWQDAPVLGVGSGNFPIAKSAYADRIGYLERPEMVLDLPMVAHNVWLQALAEIGLVGLLLQVAAIGACVASSFVAARRFARTDRVDLSFFARALGIGQLASLAASSFISNAGDRVFWVLLALGPALLAVAALRPGATPEGTR